MARRNHSRRTLAVLAIGAALSLTALAGGARADDKALPIAPEARKAVEIMGQTLSVAGFAFHERTIREYADANEQPLHIFHAANVVVRRPDRLSVNVNGDDGAMRMVYDGNNLTLYSQTQNKYASLPAKATIEATLREAASRMGVDFPLADLIADSPGKSFLSGITSGYVINTVPVDGVPCLHLFFTQPPGIELELWLENNDRALPHRLIVTYRSLPGEPRFVAEMSDWNVGIQPSDTAFALAVPAGATKVEIEQEAPK